MHWYLYLGLYHHVNVVKKSDDIHCGFTLSCLEIHENEAFRNYDIVDLNTYNVLAFLNVSEAEAEKEEL